MDKHDFRSFDELLQRSVKDPSWFWGAVSGHFGITWSKKYSSVLDDSKGIQWTKWFVGGKLNLAENCIDRHLGTRIMDKTALISESERPDKSRSVTYFELYGLVNQIANVLCGVMHIESGDKVGIFMPMIPEAVASYLAVIRAGAVAVPIFSGYGREAIISRLVDCDVRALITAESFSRRDKIVKMKQTAMEASTEIPSLDSVLVFELVKDDVLGQEERGGAHPEIYDWSLVLEQPKQFKAVQMDSEDPFMIAYTSGTTGKPKGAVHVHGGFLVKVVEEVAFQADIKAADVLFWFTDMGWIMAPWEIVGGLYLGCTLLLYDGAPDYPYPNRLWETVEKNKVSFLGVSPTLIRAQMKHGEAVAKRHDISSIRSFGSTGEPWNPESYNWLFHNIGGGSRPIVNLSGGTEVGICFLSVHPIMPLKACSLGGPCLGIDANVFDENGNPVHNETGELVVRKPWPGMTRGLWRNKDRYMETYWSRFSNIWVHGDWASIDRDGYWFLHGRSDDTLKIAGKRIGPAEIESVLTGHSAVLESMAIGVPDVLKGQSAACFVILRPGYSPSDSLRTELRNFVGKKLGESLKPSEVKFVEALPKTRNAKLVRRLVRAKYLGEPMGDMSNLENPEALDGITNAK
ncbi:MAG: AMP-binding protein [Nitrososphaerales archaeon]